MHGWKAKSFKNGIPIDNRFEREPVYYGAQRQHWREQTSQALKSIEQLGTFTYIGYINAY